VTGLGQRTVNRGLAIDTVVVFGTQANERAVAQGAARRLEQVARAITTADAVARMARTP